MSSLFRQAGQGGRLYGTSPERIAFLRGVMEEGPADGLNPLKSEWDAPSAGVQDEYYGFNQPSCRMYNMKPGIRYRWMRSTPECQEAVRTRTASLAFVQQLSCTGGLALKRHVLTNPWAGSEAGPEPKESRLFDL
ncbi:hypothetical protein [Cohnella hongkongensis]|uniref:Uncharacterized protein n=1 Tax=Cohnella hongkongensis TaxID=178337 RepID=A0ABV9FIP0_9BACL